MLLWFRQQTSRVARLGAIGAIGAIVAALLGCGRTSIPAPLPPAVRQALREVADLELAGTTESLVRLRALVDHDSEAVRAAAVRALVRNAPWDASNLRERLATEMAPRVLHELLFAVSRAGPAAVQSWLSDPNAADVLGRFVAHADPRVRVAVCRPLALQKVGAWKSLAALTRDQDPRVRRAAVLAAGEAGLLTAAAWRALAKDETDPRVRWPLFLAARADGELAQALDQELPGALGSKNFLVATFSGLALASPPEAHRVAALVERLSSPPVFWTVSAAAARALGEQIRYPSLAAGVRADAVRALCAYLRELSKTRRQDGKRVPFAVRSEVLAALTGVDEAAAASCLRDHLAGVAEQRWVVATLLGLDGELSPGRQALLRDIISEWDEPDTTGQEQELLTGARIRLTPPTSRVAVLQQSLAERDPARRAAVFRWGRALSTEWINAGVMDRDPRVCEAAIRYVERNPAALSETALRAVLGDQERAVGWWPLQMRLLSLPHSLATLRESEKAAAMEIPSPVAARHAFRMGRQRGFEFPEPRTGWWRGAPPPYPLVPLDPDAVVRPHRIDVWVRGGGNFVIEVFPRRAPHQVACFMELVRRGFFSGRRITHVGIDAGVVVGDLSYGSHPVATAPLRAEVSGTAVRRGALLALPATWVVPRDLGFRSGQLQRHGAAEPATVTTASRFVITLLPRRDLDGRLPCFGRVVIGMGVVDQLARGDRIHTMRWVR